jgi:hypothetical protein
MGVDIDGILARLIYLEVLDISADAAIDSFLPGVFLFWTNLMASVPESEIAVDFHFSEATGFRSVFLFIEFVDEHLEVFLSHPVVVFPVVELGIRYIVLVSILQFVFIVGVYRRAVFSVDVLIIISVVLIS